MTTLHIRNIPGAEEHVGAAAGFIGMLNTENMGDSYHLSLKGGVLDLTNGEAKYGFKFARASDRYKLRKIQQISKDVEKIVSEKLRILAQQPGMERYIHVDVIKANLLKLKNKLENDANTIARSHGESLPRKIANIFRGKSNHFLINESTTHTSSGSFTFSGLVGLTHTKIQQGFKIAEKSLNDLHKPSSLESFPMKSGVKALLTKPYEALDPKELRKNPNRKELEVLAKKIEELEQFRSFDPKLQTEYDMLLAMYNAVLEQSPDGLKALQAIIAQNATRCQIPGIDTLVKGNNPYIEKVLRLQYIVKSQPNLKKNQKMVLEQLALVMTFLGRLQGATIAPDMSMLDAILKRSAITPLLDGKTQVKSFFGFAPEADILETLDELQRLALNIGDESFQIQMNEIFRAVYACKGTPEEAERLTRLASQLCNNQKLSDEDIRDSLDPKYKGNVPENTRLGLLIALNLRKLAQIKEAKSGQPIDFNSKAIKVLDELINKELGNVSRGSKAGQLLKGPAARIGLGLAGYYGADIITSAAGYVFPQIGAIAASAKLIGLVTGVALGPAAFKSVGYLAGYGVVATAGAARFVGNIFKAALTNK